MGKRRIRVAGRDVDIPTVATGKEIKEIAGIPSNRQLVKEDGNGNGSARVGDNEKVRVSPDTVFEDLPTLRSG